MVNSTAVPPTVRLRILDRSGREASETQLGEDLELRIDIDDNSKFLAINFNDETFQYLSIAMKKQGYIFIIRTLDPFHLLDISSTLVGASSELF